MPEQTLQRKGIGYCTFAKGFIGEVNARFHRLCIVVHRLALLRRNRYRHGGRVRNLQRQQHRLCVLAVGIVEREMVVPHGQALQIVRMQNQLSLPVAVESSVQPFNAGEQEVIFLHRYRKLRIGIPVIGQVCFCQLRPKDCRIRVFHKVCSAECKTLDRHTDCIIKCI